MFLHSYHPQSILFDFGLIQIHWYGFLITLGALAGFFVFYKLARRVGFDKNIIFNLFFYLIIWGLIGGRVYHVLSEFGYYLQHPLKIFFIWQGGLGIFGSITAGILVVYYFSSCHPDPRFYRGEGPSGSRTSLFKGILRRPAKCGTPQDDPANAGSLLDLLSPALVLAQAIGRWGNYFNQELYGRPTNLSWGIPIDLANRAAGYESFGFFHPIFLYESLFCFLLFVILTSRAKRGEEGSRGIQSKSGKIFLLYLFLYSFWRFFIEFLRLDHQPVFFNLRLGQWLSLTLIILSLLFYFVLKKWYNKSNQQKTINN